MGMLKRKEERTETISVRVPASVKAELIELRKRARRRVSISTRRSRMQWGG